MDTRQQLDALMVAGLYEPATSLVVKRLLGHADAFVDIGANIGYFSLIAKAHALTRSVIAIEPNISCYQTLLNNAEENCFDIKVLNMAVGSEEKEVEFESLGRLGVGSSVLDPSNLAHRAALHSTYTLTTPEKYSCKMVRMDRLLHDLALGDCRLVVKIDVEGYEYEVLKGFGKALGNCLALIVERNDATLEGRGESWNAIVSFLDRAGFHGYLIWDRNPLRKILGEPTGEQGNYLFLHEKHQALMRRVAPLVIASG